MQTSQVLSGHELHLMAPDSDRQAELSDNTPEAKLLFAVLSPERILKKQREKK